MSGSSAAEIVSKLAADYIDETPQKLKLIDSYMVFCVVTGLVQFLYCVLVGTFPYNAFLAGFGSAVACFVFAANLRIKTNPKNAAQFSGSPQGY
ncbi:Dolichyl-diphosphooligosaccharide-protein glycosyltransferase subunit dad1, partial [Linderina pennispora]